MTASGLLCYTITWSPSHVITNIAISAPDAGDAGDAEARCQYGRRLINDKQQKPPLPRPSAFRKPGSPPFTIHHIHLQSRAPSIILQRNSFMNDSPVTLAGHGNQRPVTAETRITIKVNSILLVSFFQSYSFTVMSAICHLTMQLIYTSWFLILF